MCGLSVSHLLVLNYYYNFENSSIAKIKLTINLIKFGITLNPIISGVVVLVL